MSALDPQTADALASALLDAERTGVPVAPLTDERPWLTVADAYAVQRRVVASKVGAGARIVGRKVGLTSPVMQQALGVTEPDFGVLLDTMHLPDGRIALPEMIAARAEPEIALRLGAPLAGPGVTVQDALAAITGAAPALEVIDSRIEGWRIRLADTIADQASSARYVLGPEQPLGDTDLAAVQVVLLRDGSEVARGSGDAVLGHPAAAVAWVANALAGFGEGLEAGQLLLPGSLTAPVPLEAGHRLTADFGLLGRVELLAM